MRQNADYHKREAEMELELNGGRCRIKGEFLLCIFKMGCVHICMLLDMLHCRRKNCLVVGKRVIKRVNIETENAKGVGVLAQKQKHWIYMGIRTADLFWNKDS